MIEKIRQRKLNSLKRQEMDINESSNSRILIRFLLGKGMDIILWLIIAGFIYIWWTQRGIPIGCDRISVDLCNNCYGYAKELGMGGLL